MLEKAPGELSGKLMWKSARGSVWKTDVGKSAWKTVLKTDVGKYAWGGVWKISI